MNEIVIVMAFYRGQKYFKDQIDSIKRQTKLPDKLIIVNDSPEDIIATQFLHSYNYGKLNTEIIDNSKNYGCTKSFYIGIQRAYTIGAKYIFMCDQDDIWMDDKIQLQYDALEKGADVCNHYSQKFIDGKPESINYANSAGHSLAFNTKSFRRGISLISRPSYGDKKATYDSILSFIPLIYGLKWTTVDKVLVYHRLFNKEHYMINNEMHKSIFQDIKNLFSGIDSYEDMKEYLDKNASYKISTRELFNYYRKTVNKYELCDNMTKFKNKIFDLVGLMLTKSI